MKLSHHIFRGHLEDGEKIYHVAHRHPLVLKIASFKTFMLGIVTPTILFLFIPQAFLICLVWWLVGFVGMCYHFFDWYFDAWLVTTVGVIDVEVHGIFNKISTRIEYENLESISYTIIGALQTIFGYGDITIDTQGTKTTLTLKDASNPKKLEKLVKHYQNKHMTSKSIRDYDALKGMLSEMIAYHVRSGNIKDPTNSD